MLADRPADRGEPTLTGSLDLRAPRTVHVIGIGGAGMSAIATVLAQMGHRVSGSDLKDSRSLERLRLLGIRTVVGHSPENVPTDADAVVVSTAVPDDNPEVAAARARGVSVLRRADALRDIVATRRTVAVSGSHGKTTTASMLALILRGAGWEPSFLVGGELNEVGTNAAYDVGEWLVVEADESDGTFLALEPEVAVVTNVEADHLDHFGDFDALVDAFRRFVAGIPGPVVVCADDPIAAGLVEHAGQGRTYGWSNAADYRAVDYGGSGAGSSFDVRRGGTRLGRLELPVPGRHNASNALGAAAIATELGVEFTDIAAALMGFGGVARRFQFRGERDGVRVDVDYAHLPGEIEAAIAAAREGPWKRVVVVFQPHRYSRTGRLWRDFADAFVDADEVVLTDVYGAGEAPRPGVSGRLILRSVLDAHPELPVAYLPRRADLVGAFGRITRPGDVVLTLGAGDVTTLADAWLARSAS